MNTYTIKRVANRADFEAKLKELPRADISCFPWPEVNKLEPVSHAAVAYDGDALHVYMDTEEPVARAEINTQNGPVHTDSCLEFFFAPAPEKSPVYLNFEINPLGVFFLSAGTGRQDRKLVTEETAAYFGVKSLKKLEDWNGKGWEITYTLPFDFIKKYIPEFEPKNARHMRGNFYKCGDGLPSPHWACWNPISTQTPDFHRPEFFGMLTLEPVAPIKG